MCTVTYVPSTNGYFLTSNRDEKNTRSTALEPKEYALNNIKIIFPKDVDANGTWIVLKENGDSLCLLNGAFENFTAKDNYTKSRGIIVLEIASAENIVNAFETINLVNIAPFTLVIVHSTVLFECRWDGEEKHILQLDNKLPYIWSSVTLYDKSQRKVRKNWFSNFVKVNQFINQNSIINFHKNTGDENVENNLVMNRDNKYFTVSITSIAVNENILQVQYQNLLTDKIYFAKFENEFA